MFSKKSVFLFIFAIYVKCIAGDNPELYYNGDVSATSTEKNHYSMICMDIKPQHSVDIQQIMGLWYGTEIIIHTQDFPGVYEYDSCVIIHLADVTDEIRRSHQHNHDYYNNNHNRNNNYRGLQHPTSTSGQYGQSDGDYQLLGHQQRQQQIKYLRLVWSENDNNVEYTFNYTTHSPGLWSNVGDQRGSLVTLNQYTQFSGTVQVVKAVNDHLVLTFCGSDIKSSIYTIVLSRNRLGLSADELRSIRSLLSRRGLYTDTVRKVCSGAAELASSWQVLAALGLAIIMLQLPKHSFSERK